MKQSFKKVVSILLVAMLLVSAFPTMFVTTASAADTTWLNLGIYEKAGNFTLVDDPAGSGEKVVKITGQNTTIQAILAKPGTTDPFIPEAGKTYTVSFSYYLDPEASEYVGSFFLQKGNGVYPQADGRKEIPNTEKAVYKDFAGTWAPMYISYTDATMMSNKNPSNELKYLFLSNYFNDKGTGICYIKDLTVHEGQIDATTTPAIDKTLSVKAYYKDNGSGTITSTAGSGDSDDYNFAYGTENDLIVSGNADSSDSSGGSATTKGWNKSLAIEAYALTSGKTYTASFEYKLVKKGTSLKLTFNSGDVKTTQSYKYGDLQELEVSNEWQTYSLTFVAGPTDPGCLKLHLTYYGKDFELHLKDVRLTAEREEIVNSVSGNAVRLIINNNGEVIKTFGWKGEALPNVPVNAENKALGEKRMGWYTDAQLTTAAASNAVIPADLQGNEYVLYAKYPTTIIDFNHVALNTAGADYNGDLKAFKMGNGVLEVTNGDIEGCIGFMLPAYDAELPSATSTSYYKFEVDKKYNVKYFLNSTSSTHETPEAAEVTLTLADFAGSRGSRDTTQDKLVHAKLSNEPYTLSTMFTFAAGTKKPDFRNYLIRVGGDRINVTHVFDKIYIQTHDDESYEAGLGIDIKLVNNGVTEEVSPSYGSVYTMPIPAPRDGFIFAGWYDSGRTEKGNVTENDIPVHVLKVDDSIIGKTYNAVWVSTATQKIDFTEDAYNGLATGGSKSGTWSVDTTEGVAHFNGPTDDTNNYKISLFDTNGNKYLLHEGISYKVTIRYKRITAGLDGVIGVTRNNLNSYGPLKLDNDKTTQGVSSVVNDNEVSKDWMMATKTFTVFGTYQVISGSTVNLFDKVCRELSLSARSGAVDVDYVEVTPVGCVSLYNKAENGTISVDYENMKVTLTPDAGYKYKPGSLTTTMVYRDYDITTDPSKCVATVNSPVMVNQAVLASGELTFDFDFGGYSGARISALHFDAIFVSDSTPASGFVAASTRDESGAGDSYQSAGIRFKARVDASDVARADKIEYILVPAQELKNGKSIETYVAENGKYQFRGDAKDTSKGTHVIYATVDDAYIDYQAVLVGLTRQGSQSNLLGVDFKVALAITIDGVTTYEEYANARSYNSFN